LVSGARGVLAATGLLPLAWALISGVASGVARTIGSRASVVLRCVLETQAQADPLALDVDIDQRQWGRWHPHRVAARGRDTNLLDGQFLSETGVYRFHG
jgi:hypothetical protein